MMKMEKEKRNKKLKWTISQVISLFKMFGLIFMKVIKFR